jgi:signal transduction histidine kinase
MQTMSLVVTLLAVIFNLVVGFYVWRANKRQPAHYFFFLFTAELSLWTLFNYFATAWPEVERSLFFVRLVMAVTAPLPVTIFYFTLAFPNHKSFLARGWRLALDFWTLLLALASLFTPWMFSQAQVTAENKLVLTSSWGIFLVAINIAILGSLSVYQFYRNAWEATGLIKARVRLLLATFSLGVVSAIICNFVLVNIFHTNAYVSIGTWLMSLFMVGGIGHAMLKIRFTDIAFRLAQGIYITLLIFWVTLFFYDFVLLFQLLGKTAFIVSFPLFIVWLWLFNNIQKRLRPFLLRTLAHHGLDWKIERAKLLERLSRELDFKTITSATLDFFAKLIPNTGSLIIGDFMSENDNQPKVSIGALTLRVKSSDFLAQCRQYWTSKGYRPIVYEELNVAKGWQHRMLLLFMHQSRVAIVIPLLIYGDCRGALLLSHKKNLDLYYLNEISFMVEVLDDVMPIVNQSLIYEKSRNFNEYLQRRIARATAKLQKKNKELIEADKLKDEFVSVASHELRTPMTAIKDYMWLIDKNNQTGKTQENSKYIQIVMNSNERLISLVNDMLTVSRIEGERYQLNLIKTDLRTLAQAAVDDLAPLAKEKKIKLVITPHKRAQLAMVDKDKIIEVLHNIVGNALKFTQKGEVRLTFHRGETGKIQLAVSDTGAGVAPEDFPKLFRKFSRLEKSYVKLKETGTGLGLYISRQIMRLHHGDISFTSELGKGSVFTLTFKTGK